MTTATTRPATPVVRRAAERGRSDLGWLDSRHTFSFSGYYDPAQMGFRALRVINDDRVAAGRGFGMHGHADMEILSYVVSGELAHRDSLGNGETIRPGDVQRMTAGTGIRHSEFNPSATAPVRFLQIWIEPEREGLKPGYEQRFVAPEEKAHRLRLVASRDGRDGSVVIHQDVALSAGLLSPGDRVRYDLAAGRHAWLQVVRGTLTANGTALAEGDGARWSAATPIELTASADSEVLLFDLG